MGVPKFILTKTLGGIKTAVQAVKQGAGKATQFIKENPVKTVATGAAFGVGAVIGSSTGSSIAASDTTSNGPVKQTRGPLSPLSKSLFDFQELRYPANVGASDFNSRYPYYMKFYINVSEKSQYQTRLVNPTFPNPSQFSQTLSTTELQQFFRRKTKRTGKSILLYMPDTLIWGFNHQWAGESLTQATGTAGIVGALISSGANFLTGTTTEEKQQAFDAIKRGTASGLQKIVGTTAGLNITDELVQAKFGAAVNPNEELLYKGPGFREFMFEFTFAPRNAADAQTALQIIQEFKFHAAPELPGGDGGRYFIPPSDFDIEFYNADGLMWQLGSIGRCVLQNINVNYAASGQFASFSDGYPSHIQIQLQFKEIDIVTKRQIEESGF